MANALPAEMTVIETPVPGGPEALVPGRRPVPTPGPGEVLIRIAAAGVNRADCMQRAGSYPLPPGASDIIGLECSGTVAALGEGVEGWAVGEPVCALLSGDGYCEYTAVPAAQCMAVPDGVDLIDAGGLPETYATVWANVFQACALRPGETFLVQGGSSGIGTTAIQLAKAWAAPCWQPRAARRRSQPARRSAPTGRSTIARRISRRPRARRRAGPMSSSTWWAATTSTASSSC